MFRIVIQFLSCNLLRNGAGFVFKEWWDLSAEAGPQSRPGEQFSEPKPQMEVLVLDSAQNALKFFSCNQESLFKFESFNLHSIPKASGRPAAFAGGSQCPTCESRADLERGPCFGHARPGSGRRVSASNPVSQRRQCEPWHPQTHALLSSFHAGRPAQELAESFGASNRVVRDSFLH